MMKVVIVILFVLLVLCSSNILACGATKSADIFLANIIDVSQCNMTLMDITCVFGCHNRVIGKITDLKRISIGDTVTYGNYTFRVGIIEVHKYNEDIRFGTLKHLSKKGDMDCVVARSEDDFPEVKGEMFDESLTCPGSGSCVRLVVRKCRVLE